ncbi:cell surface glycoprotein (s-layer protein)-like protein [Anaeramoeba flamelloides]|uniref:Cell surface glycoprotein (S-layer protein)-like protein n=1 Tax=Anaeramoeba flamelloides TaxID=1746091 RepID=A0ABQ8XFS6_9EUKA|nr:cell surface glycoprotein (s-layer protein)-like protein [Anaeramoeba flamelloides]
MFGQKLLEGCRGRSCSNKFLIKRGKQLGKPRPLVRSKFLTKTDEVSVENQQAEYTWAGKSLVVTFTNKYIRFVINKTWQVSLHFPNSNMDQMRIYEQKCNRQQPLRFKGKSGSCGFGKVIYRSLYSGIDLEFMEDHEGLLKSNYYIKNYKLLPQLELEFVTTLRLQINTTNHALEFVERTTTHPNKEYKRLKANKKDHPQNEAVFRESVPIIIQNKNQFQARYEITSVGQQKTRITFRLDNDGNILNKKKPFIIDPTYSSFLGGTRNDRSSSCKIDVKDQSFFLVGGTDSASFPTSIGSYQQVKSDMSDGFITKFNLTTGKLIWSSFLGSKNNDVIKDIAIDEQGNAIVAVNSCNPLNLKREQTKDTLQNVQTLKDFPTTNNSETDNCNLPNSIRNVIFMSKFTYNGNDLHWSNLLCLKSNLEVNSMKYPGEDTSELILTGITDSQFSTCTFQGESDIFVIKIEEGSTSIKDLLCFGGDYIEHFTLHSDSAMYLDDKNSIFITGATSSSNFNENGKQNNYIGGNSDCFFVEIDYETFDLIFWSYYGTDETDYCDSVFYHTRTELIWFGGSTNGRNLNTTENAFQPTSNHHPHSKEFEGFFFAIHKDNKTIFYQSYLGNNNSKIEINSIKIENSIKNPSSNQIIISGQGFLFGDGGDHYPDQNIINRLQKNDLGNEFGENTTEEDDDDNKGSTHYDFGQGGFVVIFQNMDSLNTVYKSISVGCDLILGLDLYNNTSSSILLSGNSNGNNDLKTLENSFQPHYRGGTVDSFFIYLQLVCEEFMYKSDHSNLCQECPKGTFIRNYTTLVDNNSNFLQIEQDNNFDNTCQYCPLGYYSSAKGSVECEKCPIGTFSNVLGLSECFHCVPGTYTTIQGSTDQSSCIACPQGTYSIQKRNEKNILFNTCQKCPQGSYNPYSGITSSDFCLVCPAGTYNDKEGATSYSDCRSCPDYQVSNGTGATECWDCDLGYETDIDNNYCKPCGRGSYRDTKISTCKKCVNGEFNNKEGMTFCYKCNLPDGCKGGNECSEHRDTSKQCETCQDGYYMLNFTCVPCQPRYLIISIYVCFGVFLLTLIFLVFNDKFSNHYFQNSNHGKIFWYFFQKSQTPIKEIILNYLQIFSAILFLKLNWPSQLLNEYLRITTSCFNLEFDTLLFNECYDKFNFLSKMIITISLLVLWFIVYQLFIFFVKNSNKPKKERKEKIYNATYKYTLSLKYLYLPLLIISSQIFDFQFDKSTKNFVKPSNNRLKINEKYFSFFLFLNILLIILGVVGIPLYFLKILIKAKKCNFQSRKLNQQYGWLWLNYKKNKYYWQLIDLLFKLLLICSSMLTERIYTENLINNYIQEIIVLIIIAIYIVCIIILKPYKGYDDKSSSNFLAENKIILALNLFLLSIVLITINQEAFTSVVPIVYPIISLLIYFGFKDRFYEYYQNCLQKNNNLRNFNPRYATDLELINIKHMKKGYHLDKNDKRYGFINMKEDPLGTIKGLKKKKQKLINNFIQNINSLNSLKNKIKIKQKQLRQLRQTRIEIIRNSVNNNDVQKVKIEPRQQQNDEKMIYSNFFKVTSESNEEIIEKQLNIINNNDPNIIKSSLQTQCILRSPSLDLPFIQSPTSNDENNNGNNEGQNINQDFDVQNEEKGNEENFKKNNSNNDLLNTKLSNNNVLNLELKIHKNDNLSNFNNNTTKNFRNYTNNNNNKNNYLKPNEDDENDITNINEISKIQPIFLRQISKENFPEMLHPNSNLFVDSNKNNLQKFETLKTHRKRHDITNSELFSSGDFDIFENSEFLLPFQEKTVVNIGIVNKNSKSSASPSEIINTTNNINKN